MHTQPPPEDAIAAVTHPDPYPYYALLAERPTLVLDPGTGLWIAAHPDLVREVMAHPSFDVRPRDVQVPATIAGPAGSVFGALVRMNDGARHAGHKHALAQALQGVTSDTAARCADDVAAWLLRDGLDDAAALNRFVSALPVCTVARLLGFPEAQLDALRVWTGQFVACLSPLSTEEDIAHSHAGAQALLTAMRELLERRPRAVTGLLHEVRAAAWQDEHALLSNLAGLLSQSYEATAGLLGNCIVALLRGADPAGLVQRTMGDDPAIHNTRRFAAADTRIGGVTVGAGQAVLLILAANRAAYSFGHGRHACPGQALAQTIVTQGLQALAGRDDLPRVRWRYRVSVNARLPEFLEQPQ